MEDKKAVKKIVTKTFEDSKFHGLSNIVKANSYVIRMFWVFLFLVCFAFCTYFITKCILDFFKYETTISISYVRDAPSNFPAITICNLNPYNEQRAWDQINRVIRNAENTSCLGDLSNITLSKTCLNETSVIRTEEFIIKYLTRIIANLNLTKANQAYYGFTLDEMMTGCEFNGIACSPRHFTQFWHNDYGNCYTFNGNLENSIKTNVAGCNYGLKINIVSQPYNNESFWYLKYAYRTGLYLLVHNQTTKPITLSSGINIRTFGETYVSVKRSILNKLESPYSNCIKDLTPFSDYSRRLFSYFSQLNVSKYDQDVCVSLCYQDKLVDNCSCCSTQTNSVRNVHYCQSQNELICEANYTAYFSTADTNVICDNVCREECQKETFDITSSLATFPIKLYYSTLIDAWEQIGKIKQNTTLAEFEDFFQQSLSRIIVNYGELRYTQIDETAAISFEQLLGSIGGNLGLFVGASFLTFFEVIEMATDLISLIFRKCCCRGQSYVT